MKAKMLFTILRNTYQIGNFYGINGVRPSKAMFRLQANLDFYSQ